MTVRADRCVMILISMLLSMLAAAHDKTLVISSGNASAQPFVRDVTTGDLLCCNFNAREPYCWKGAPMLSGWETDMSGGSWDYAMKKGFDLEWFKLIDSSNKAAVTIQHQVSQGFRLQAHGAMGQGCIPAVFTSEFIRTEDVDSR